MSSDVPISIEAQIQAVNIAAANATADAREDERNFAAHAAALRAAAETLRKVQAGELVPGLRKCVCHLPHTGAWNCPIHGSVDGSHL